jgi:hypothetical protein
MNQSFATEMKTLGFDLEGTTLSLRNRSKGYDNDCSDDERDDEFYEDRTNIFDCWADPIMNKVYILAKKHSVKIHISTSAEYGMIDVEVK